MAIYYSPTTLGFYDTSVGYNSYPDDIIEIDKETHNILINEMYTNSKEIYVLDGKILLRDREDTITWNNIRAKRNKLLKNSDHKVMPDYPSDKEAWGTYRQALRDITKTFTEPNDVIWPTEPK